MSTIAVALPYDKNYPSMSSLGYGHEAVDLVGKLYDICRKVKGTPMSFVDSTLQEIYYEHSTNGWDGYDALPISQNSYIDSAHLLCSLPDGIPTPDIMPEPTGRIAFEWRKGRSILVISISGRGLIFFAWIHGGTKMHGVLPYYDSLPKELITFISQMGL